jgi:1,4-dihydroxy-2-naphthoate octaprenyltransferase
MGFAAYAAVARAPFLLLPVTLVAAGTGAAIYLGMPDWAHAGLALLGLVGVHVTVNALNEASDYRSGIDLNTQRTPFSGGSGTLPAGLLSYRAAVATGLIGGAVGIAVGIYFLTTVGTRLLPILAVGALAAFGYSGILGRAYVGELFAGLGLGALPVVATTLVQTGSYETVAIAASLPAFFMTFNLLLLNEFPDEEADRVGGRRNLVLLLGRKKAALLYVLFSLFVPVSLIAGVALDHLPSLTLVAIAPTFLLIPVFRWALVAPATPVTIPGLGSNVIWNLSTNAILGVALMLS